MNKVYLSGTVADMPQAVASGRGAAHTVFALLVTQRTHSGKTVAQRVAVHAWREVAVQAYWMLRQGQQITLSGRLMQRPCETPGCQAHTCFVAADEIVLACEAVSNMVPGPVRGAEKARRGG